MTARLNIEIEQRPLYRVSADLLIIPFSGVDPFKRGALAWADWRLCGLLRQQMKVEEMMQSGAATLVPSSGRLRAAWLLAVSMGEGPATTEVLRQAVPSWFARSFGLKARHVALALPEIGELERACEQVVLAWATAMVCMKEAEQDLRLMGCSSCSSREMRLGVEKAVRRGVAQIDLFGPAPKEVRSPQAGSSFPRASLS